MTSKLKTAVADLYGSLLLFKSQFRDAAADPTEAESDLRRMGIFEALSACEEILRVE